jgi:hypothetical protein
MIFLGDKNFSFSLGFYPVGGMGGETIGAVAERALPENLCAGARRSPVPASKNTDFTRSADDRSDVSRKRASPFSTKTVSFSFRLIHFSTKLKIGRFPNNFD